MMRPATHTQFSHISTAGELMLSLAFIVKMSSSEDLNGIINSKVYVSSAALHGDFTVRQVKSPSV